MVLPLLVGLGVTVAALTAKATVETVKRCRRLTVADIARFNGIQLNHNSTIWPKDTPYWRNFQSLGDSMYNGGFADVMSKEEAMLILGVDSTMSWKEINKRHKAMMMFNHPDKGGSKHIAVKVNKAKEVLEMYYK